MQNLTPAERRGVLVVLLLLAIGTLHDSWRARHPEPAEPLAGRAAGAAPASDTLTGDTSGGRRPSLEGKASIRAGPGPAGPIDPNQASVEELDALPGIGPVLASRIIEHRRRHGDFVQAEDLLAVQGIGPRLLERLRPWLALGERHGR